jgi:hypothetical protein
LQAGGQGVKLYGMAKLLSKLVAVLTPKRRWAQ